MRGWQEYRKLHQADLVFVTCPKSGRTWVRIMLSRILQRRHDLPETAVVGSTAFHRANPSLPVVLFTHDTNIGNYTGNRDSKADYAGKRIVLLVRDPRDIAVSSYFQWKYRMDPQKRALRRQKRRAHHIRRARGFHLAVYGNDEVMMVFGLLDAVVDEKETGCGTDQLWRLEAAIAIDLIQDRSWRWLPGQ